MFQVTDSHCTHFEAELHFILSTQHVHGNSVTYLSFQALFAHITIGDNSENIKNILNSYVLNVNNKVYVIISSGNLKRWKDASIGHLDISTFVCYCSSVGMVKVDVAAGNKAAISSFVS